MSPSAASSRAAPGFDPAGWNPHRQAFKACESRPLAQPHPGPAMDPTPTIDFEWATAYCTAMAAPERHTGDSDVVFVASPVEAAPIVGYAATAASNKTAVKYRSLSITLTLRPWHSPMLRRLDQLCQGQGAVTERRGRYTLPYGRSPIPAAPCLSGPLAPTATKGPLDDRYPNRPPLSIRRTASLIDLISCRNTSMENRPTAQKSRQQRWRIHSEGG